MRSILLLLLGLGCIGCSDSKETEATEPAWDVPEDAVVQIGPGEYFAEPVFIRTGEIERWVDTVSRLEPEESLRSWKRKALTNINMPIAIAGALVPEERLAARDLMAELRPLLLAGEPLPEYAPEVEHRTGNAIELELPIWGTAVLLPTEGVWSEVIETRGGFAMVRRAAPSETDFSPIEPLHVELFLCRYLHPIEAEAMIEDARPKLGVRSLELKGWEGILPAYYEFE